MGEEIRFDNRERFTGISEVYHSVRPHFPERALHILSRYLREKPACGVDLGCGTGLSTYALASFAENVIGVDPNRDMLRQARAFLAEVPNAVLLQCEAEQLELESETADIVICSQAFHWMDPEIVIPEICRILRPGGVFAAVDYDWPAVFDVESELAYEEMVHASEKILALHPELVGQTHKWSKDRHMDNLRTFGAFRYVREIAFSSEEPCSGKRYYRMAASQSGVQAVLRSPYADELSGVSQKFYDAARLAEENGVQSICIPYRMRVGIR